MDCPLHIQNDQSVFIIILYTRDKQNMNTMNTKEYINSNCVVNKQKDMSQKLKEKKS
jgi:hypothetical protein